LAADAGIVLIIGVVFINWLQERRAAAGSMRHFESRRDAGLVDNTEPMFRGSEDALPA
jgi:hypothetical protein